MNKGREKVWGKAPRAPEMPLRTLWGSRAPSCKLMPQAKTSRIFFFVLKTISLYASPSKLTINFLNISVQMIVLDKEKELEQVKTGKVMQKINLANVVMKQWKFLPPVLKEMMLFDALQFL